eukprot:gene8927-biopygen12172
MRRGKRKRTRTGRGSRHGPATHCTLHPDGMWLMREDATGMCATAHTEPCRRAIGCVDAARRGRAGASRAGAGEGARVMLASAVWRCVLDGAKRRAGENRRGSRHGSATLHPDGTTPYCTWLMREDASVCATARTELNNDVVVRLAVLMPRGGAARCVAAGR